jgi:hypothetical protein
MRDVLAALPDLPPFQRSVVASLASILEVDSSEVPAPVAEHPEPWTVWRNWLAQRGLGLVPVADPATFSWPGPWLALLRSHADGGLVAAVAFGSPPGIAWKPLGGSEGLEAVEAGYVVAAADPTRERRAQSETVRACGRVEAIVIAPAAEAPAVLVDEAHAERGRGLEGDRYYEQRGTFSNPHARGIDLTLIEDEVVDELALRSGGFGVGDARRNIVTRGVDLNALVGRRFRIGEVECLGQRLCEPCAHLERLTAPGVLRALVHRGGLRADILTSGVIRLQDRVVAR